MCCPRVEDKSLSEHFDIKTEEETAVQGVSVVGNVQEENVGLKDCDNIQVTSDRTNVYKHICVYVVIQYLNTYNF